MRADRLRELRLERGHVGAREGRRDDGVRPLEEVVDDLDLLRPGAEARERVDEPLQPVVGLDDLLRRALGERVRLVVEDERARARRGGGRPAVRAGGRRRARTRTAAPAARLRARRSAARASEPQYDATKPRSASAPRRSRPDTRRAPARRPAARAPRRSTSSSRRWTASPTSVAARPLCPATVAVRRPRPHAGDPLGVVAVRAALEERERAVREPAHAVQRRLRQRLDRRELRRRAAAAAAPSPAGEERELAGLVVDDRGSPGSTDAPARRPAARSTRTSTRAPSALELDRRLARARELVGAVEPVEHPADRRLLVAPSLRVDRRRRRSAGRSRGSSRRSRGAAARPRSSACARVLAPRRSRERRARSPVAGSATWKPKRPSESARISSAGGGLRSRPASATTTTLNSSPFARVDREQPDRVGALLLGDRLELARADGLLLARRSGRSPRRRGRAAPRTSARAARACAGSRSGGAPSHWASTARS